jgi:hypothetical protein
MESWFGGKHFETLPSVFLLATKSRKRGRIPESGPGGSLKKILLIPLILSKNS